MSAARNKRRRHGRRGRFGFLYKMLAFVALAAALILGAAVFFRVETIRVEGNVRYQAQQVIQATQVMQGDNLFGLNKNEVARKIRQTLPYVEGVAIRRNLPDTLVIRVEENTDTGEDGDGGGDTGSYTNQVSTSVDTDGSIFNGTGYKTGYRLNSSGQAMVLCRMYRQKKPPFRK